MSAQHSAAGGSRGESASAEGRVTLTGGSGGLTGGGTSNRTRETQEGMWGPGQRGPGDGLVVAGDTRLKEDPVSERWDPTGSGWRRRVAAVRLQPWGNPV